MQTAAQVQSAIDSFADDPADSPFQRGYLAALEWVMERDDRRALEPDEIASMLTQRAMLKRQ